MNSELFLDKIKSFISNVLLEKIESIESESTIPKTMLKELGQLGAFGAIIPKEQNGLGLSADTLKDMIYMLALHSPTLALTMGIPVFSTYAIACCGQQELNRELLPKLIKGEQFCAFAYTEKGNTSIDGLKTKITRDANGYTINGEKMMISWAGEADYYLVIANLAINDKSSRPAAIVIDAAQEHVKTLRIIKKIGFDGLVLGELVFKHAHAGDNQLIGRPGSGLKVADKALQLGRLCLATVAVAMGAKTLSDIKETIKQPSGQGYCLADNQSVQMIFAELFIKQEAAVVLLDKAWRKWENNDRDQSIIILTAKVVAARTILEIVNEAWKLAGGTGYLKDHPMEKRYRQARIFGIIEGANDVLVNQMAKQLLR